jgi:hypothetical protein
MTGYAMTRPINLKDMPASEQPHSERCRIAVGDLHRRDAVCVVTILEYRLQRHGAINGGNSSA